MKSIYIRPTNIVFGQKADYFIQEGTAKSLCGLDDVGFLSVEILKRQSDGHTVEEYSVLELEKLDFRNEIENDLNKITIKRKNIFNLNFKNPILMGVLNVTPDSFSDGGKFNKKNLGYKHALSLVQSGAKILDIGGESTRPGSKPISSKIEWLRINKTLKKLVKKNIVSLDSRKSDIIEKGIKLGVNIINDVSGMSFDDNTINILKKYNIPFVLQHTKGTPQFMQKNPNYENVILEIYDYFEKKIKLLRNIGIKHNKIIIDPGIGFGKNVKHNVQILKNISIFHSLGFPILLGISRKRFIKDLAGINDSKFRLGGTVSSSIFAIMQGVQILRVHDVNEVNQAIKVFKKLNNQ